MSEWDDINDILERCQAYPLLSRSHEKTLAERWRQYGDESAKDELFKSHMRLAASEAIQNRGFGLPVWDMFSEGCIGLIKAIERFDPDFGSRLSTYASWWIRAQIHHYVLCNWHIISGGRDTSAKKLLFKLGEICRDLGIAKKEALDEYDINRISEATGINVKIVRNFVLRQLNANTISTQHPTGEDENMMLEEVLAEDDRHENSLVERIDQNDRWHLIKDAMKAHLKDREHAIISERYLRDDPLTLESLSYQYGVSRERIRQIELIALRKLRQRTRHGVPDRF